MAVITISRGSFSGGRAVAERLASRIGHPLLSREQVLAQAAGEFGISEKELSAALNESPPFWRQVPGKRLAYVKAVTAVLLNHARNGDLVYHGHVGHLLLASVSHVLKVRVIADMEQRTRAAMEQMKLSRPDAVVYIQRVDRDRSRWARLLYGVEWDDPNQYDLVVNLARLSVDGAADIIARTSQMPEFQPTDASRKALEDLSLSCRVWAALARDPKTRSAGIDVTADDGQVLISGSVGSSGVIDAIAATAATVPGVKSVRTEMAVGSDWHW
jgi:cytidylate kinase